MDSATIIGYLATIFLVLGYLPQTIQSLKTRSTDNIAFGTFLLLGLGSIFFMIQGFMLKNYPLAITNIITTTMSSIVFGTKIVTKIIARRKKNRMKDILS